MFFRRRRPRILTFSDRMEELRKAGFAVASLPDGSVRISRGGCAIDLKEEDTAVHAADRAGLLFGSEIATLVDGGFQKFFRAPSGKQKPAAAEELSALHVFEEDLKGGLGEESYYNEALGTVSTFYLYDRLTDRDRGAPKRVWE
ncbi:MAG: hypothetical protein ABSC23_05945 [Bryobacteraceae bacterium]|jgi:hypothetical protein